ncbi:MAG: spermidine synthase, partial [Chloroflexi bacterium]|nr:spermidine synthase [Chloroflexota bacterium]
MPRPVTSDSTPIAGLVEDRMPPIGVRAGALPRERAQSLRLFALSFLMLFVELSLIRWTAANDIHLAYLTNFVLLASFLGIGLGFLRARKGPDLLQWAPIFLAAMVAFVLIFPVTVNLATGKLTGAFGWTAAPRWVELTVTFGLTVAIMACIGHGVAQQFVRFQPLQAYRLDIFGSLAGTIAFTLLSFLELTPIWWGAVVSVLLVVLLGRRWQLIALLGALALLGYESHRPNEHWSPYYKITASYAANATVSGVPTHGVLTIKANNIPHQTALSVATLRRIERFYFFPYRHLAHPPGNMLIVGAGSGNDVAVALSEGAKHIDAVEIDPEIQALGRRYHPDHPYQNPRVSVHIDDGRAFVEDTRNRYNLIVFALPDSLTLFAGQGVLRLENYLFTKESMERVRSLLAPGGTFAMYNYYEGWLRDRYAGTLAKVYGRVPCVEVGDTLAGRQQAVLTDSLAPIAHCRTFWRPVPVREPTDDYPFPYLPHPQIPAFYWHTLVLMLAAAVLLIGIAGGGPRAAYGGMLRYVDLAFMGAAFLLLETKNVVQFALLFGTTWLVNALVFIGVLLAVWAAIETTRRLRLPPAPVLYLALAAALVLAWAVPQESLLSLSPVPRFFAATALAFAPIYL